MKNFIKEILSDSSNTSSKRLAGLSGWYCFIAIILGVIALDLNVSDKQESLINTLAYSSAGLLTAGGVMKVISNKQK